MHMGTISTNNSLLSPSLLLLLLFIPVIYATANVVCTTSACSSSSTFVVVQFPFVLPGAPQNCGFPGFDLITCNDQGVTVIDLPYSGGDFFVRLINYSTQEIQLYDPSGCLPKRLLSLDLTGTPFMAAHYVNYTFLTCPANFTMYGFTTIDCLSNSTHQTLAIPTSTTSLAAAIPADCKTVFTRLIPFGYWPPDQDDSDFSSALGGGDDLQLAWNEPNCEDCAIAGGTCGFVNITSQQVTCVYNTGPGNNDAFQAFRIIALTIALPILMGAAAVGIFMCCINRSHQRGGGRTVQQDFEALAQQQNAVVAGLDESTIQSFTKVVIGESRRLPGPNDVTCAICLSEYNAKETVRLIPECKHCFHADCIDGWLRLNSTCPVCRTSPSPVHLNSLHS